MAKAKKQTPHKKLRLKDLLGGALLTPIVVKAVAVTVLTYVFVYVLNFIRVLNLIYAFLAVFLALIVMQEIQSGTKEVEHSAKELAGLALIIALIVWLGGVSLVAFSWVPIAQTLVITFISIILYLYIFHPTKMDKEYVALLKENLGR